MEEVAFARLCGHLVTWHCAAPPPEHCAGVFLRVFLSACCSAFSLCVAGERERNQCDAGWEQMKGQEVQDTWVDTLFLPELGMFVPVREQGSVW